MCVGSLVRAGTAGSIAVDDEIPEAAMNDTIVHHENAEHAEHAAGHGNKRAALLIAVLAAGLAICEQQGKHAEITVQENAILTADAWAQYQAKSIRSAIALDIARLGATLDRPVQPDMIAMRADLLKDLASDQVRYEKDTKDGKRRLRSAPRPSMRCARTRWSGRTPTITRRRRWNSASCWRPPR